MIKWYCFTTYKFENVRLKAYVPAVFRDRAPPSKFSVPFLAELFMAEIGIGVMSMSRANGSDHVMYSVTEHSDLFGSRGLFQPRAGFQAAEKIFASEYPELYLQEIMTSGARSREKP